MAELDRFDSQLTAAVQRFADRARTEVDAVAVATRAARGRRTSAAGWFGRTVSVPIVLILALLLVAMLMASLAVGGWWPFRSSVVTVPPTSPNGPAAATSQPFETPDAGGTVHVTGTESIAAASFGRPVADGYGPSVMRGVVGVTSTTSDPRASGTATFTFDIDGDAGTEWGSFSIQGANGGWQGPCTGSVDMALFGWDSGIGAVGTCWLTGRGAYAGFTYFRAYSWVPGQVWVEGIIYPGPPPAS
ncbi:MAG TPA: hypothetical protein VET90_01045 [Candidatus Binatus sp.]|nr:hypothetical protein [Candidatus Binatus sp.]